LSEELKPPHPIARVDGSEAFDGTDATVADFWRWAFSDLRQDLCLCPAVQGELPGKQDSSTPRL